MQNLHRELSLIMEEKGCIFKLLPLLYLSEIRYKLESYHSNGHLNDQFYKERLTDFRYIPPKDFSTPKSIIIIAVPQPIIHVRFVWKSKEYMFVIPPTYITHINKNIEELLNEMLIPEGYRLSPAVLPLKQLAVHSGLGVYGKNNICYIPGKGSFQRLLAFYTDYYCEDNIWIDDQVLDRCNKCAACVNSCPTGAISSDRFLIRAERCISYLNEGPDDFPEWLDPSWHNCIVGCMTCQIICPENKRFLKWTEEIQHFSEFETNLIIQRTKINHLPITTVEKLIQLDLVDYYNILPRNLNVLFNKSIRS